MAFHRVAMTALFSWPSDDRLQKQIEFSFFLGPFALNLSIILMGMVMIKYETEEDEWDTIKPDTSWSSSACRFINSESFVHVDTTRTNDGIVYFSIFIHQFYIKI